MSQGVTFWSPPGHVADNATRRLGKVCSKLSLQNPAAALEVIVQLMHLPMSHEMHRIDIENLVSARHVGRTILDDRRHEPNRAEIGSLS